MRLASIVSPVFALTTLLAAGDALAEDRCADPDAARVVSMLGRVPGSAALEVTRTPTRVALVDKASRRVVVEARCDGLRIPLADGLERPVHIKDTAATRVEGAYTVSLTARGVVSLSIAPGVAAPEGLEVTTFDDDSLTLGDDRGRVLYAVRHLGDGTRVETEGAHVGCGCERTIRPDGRRSERRL